MVGGVENSIVSNDNNDDGNNRLLATDTKDNKNST